MGGSENCYFFGCSTLVDVHTASNNDVRLVDCFERINKLDRDYSNWQIWLFTIGKKFQEGPVMEQDFSGRSGGKFPGTTERRLKK